MKETREEQRHRLLATGVILGTTGALGVILPLICGVPDAMGAVAFPVGFLVGLSAGLGTALTLGNIRPP